MSIELTKFGINSEIAEILNQIEIKGPEFCSLNPELTAKAMLAILGANYGTHNLTTNWEPLAEDIKNGTTKPFLSLDKEGSVVACAALIKGKSYDVEIGRGACWPGKTGGHALPILIAAIAWKEGKYFPETQVLRGEVRTAKPTKEVPGGQATQVICFKKIELVATAMAPLFHHGIPDRQEIFMLASKFRNPNLIKQSAIISRPIPNCLFSNPNEEETFTFFWENLFDQPPCIENSFLKKTKTPANFAINQEGPLLILRPSDSKSNTDFDILVGQAFREGTRFALARVPLASDKALVSNQIITLRDLGFRVVGYEPVVSSNGAGIDLLLGKLSPLGKEKLVAPSFVEEIFSHQTEDALMEDSLSWRRQ